MGSLLACEQRKPRHVDKPGDSAFQSKVMLSSQRKFRRDNSINLRENGNDKVKEMNGSQVVVTCEAKKT
jgi:hypothetical protein